MSHDEMRTWILNEITTQIGDGTPGNDSSVYALGYGVGLSHGLANFGRSFEILNDADDADIQRRAGEYERHAG